MEKKLKVLIADKKSSFPGSFIRFAENLFEKFFC